MPKPKLDFRDVSYGLQRLRDFLLGREHTLHNRFPPCVSPRSIPAPDIPRGPDNKYANKYYCNRSPYNIVKPPVVAPVAEGMTKKAIGGEECSYEANKIAFEKAPTPGTAWWWDGHFYYECPDTSNKPKC